MPKPLSRRTLLRGLGTAVALPSLDAMTPRAAAAGSAGPPLRMAFVYVPNGIHMADWTPTAVGRDFDLPPTLARLSEHRDHFSVLSGLTLDGARAHGDGGGDHARSVAAFLTGAHPRKTNGSDIHNGVSVDQVTAQYVGDRTRFATLELGLEGSSQSGNCDSGYSCAYASNLSWRGPTNPMGKEVDPAALFDRLFAGQTVRETAQVKSVRERYRKSVLDFITEDAKRLHRVLPSGDRRKLDEYLYSVREIERRMGTTPKLRSDEKDLSNYPRPSGVPREMSEHAQLMMDMMVLAMRTDSTRILSFMMTNAGSNRSYPEVNVNSGHHEQSHHGGSPEKQTNVAAINRFHIDQFAYLLGKLREAPEGEGTLLDHSMIVYGSGISDGDRHNHDNLPILLAGGAGGRVKPGAHLRYDKETPLCDLYLWMMRQMGATAERFGDSRGPLNI